MVAAIPLGASTPVRAGLGSGASADCPATDGLPAVTRQTVAFTGSLSCYRPGAPGFNSTASRATELTRSDNPYQGQFCMNVYYYPVSFAESDDGSIRASFSFNGGGGSGIPLSADDARQATVNDALIAEAQTGSYQPSNPSDPTSPLTCNLDATYHRYCPTGTPPVGSACYIWVAHDITPATSPSPSIALYMNAIVGQIHGDAGTVHSLPTQTGVVNAPVCFWIDGMGIPSERDLVLTLPGAPDASQRRIYYTYLIRITFQDPVQWDFGDPHDPGNAQTQPDPACGQHPQLTAHQYTEISDDVAPDGRYHVTAHERYAITASLYWVDSTQSAAPPVPVDPGVSAPVISPPDYAQYVGQVEGIPVGG